MGACMRKLALAMVAAVAVPASAQTPTSVTVTAEPGKNVRDPNEVVCEKIEVIGSRLIAKRVCATRAQWAERRLQERLDLDRAQKTGMKSE